MCANLCICQISVCEIMKRCNYCRPEINELISSAFSSVNLSHISLHWQILTPPGNSHML